MAVATEKRDIQPEDRLSPTSVAFMRLNHDNMSSSHRLRTASVHHKTPTFQEQDHDEDAPLHILMTTYLGYGILILFGHLRDFFGKIFKKQEYASYQEHDVTPFFSLTPWKGINKITSSKLRRKLMVKKMNYHICLIGLCAIDFWL